MLAAAIDKLIGDPDMRQELASKALIAVRERFSLETMVDATERVYREVLLEQRSRN